MGGRREVLFNKKNIKTNRFNSLLIKDVINLCAVVKVWKQTGFSELGAGLFYQTRLIYL